MNRRITAQKTRLLVLVTLWILLITLGAAAVEGSCTIPGCH